MTKLRVLGIQMLNEVIYMYKVIPGVFFFFYQFYCWHILFWTKDFISP